METSVPNKSLTLPSGAHYAYIHYAPSAPKKPTLLFIHGFPSTSHDWRHQISHFRSRGYGILALDCLGYGGSSKPLDVEAYVGSKMSVDVIGILHHEGLDNGKVIGIAHDWGTYLLSQLASRYPSRFDKFVFMSVPYSPPGRGLDVAAINAMTKKAQGFEQFGYWLFFTAEGAGKVIGKHWEAFFSLVYAQNPSIWAHSFAGTNSLKSFLESGSYTHLGSYITEADKTAHHTAFGDDYSAPVHWYKRGIQNLGVEEEKEGLKNGSIKEKIEKETLMVTGLRDVVCQAGHARASMGGTVEKGKLRVVDVDAGHWIMLEKAEETNRLLEEFFEGKKVMSVL